ncbi:MAG: spermidine/putrescine ABC transporter ATP-binding protein [Cytophagales bacterium CG12_big_fil_rev_8_21_14_0_65_40_12]|nr:MAG: spermidine/putrescine ABC transporter ATP-binding protein [Cytophagales bacterium CG12_big_fil_rev_8_21_14_0_65_40_12]PIW04494.1 MAG: spermidine/putrescine ABC transporter ATP-binding protein [Cytophagales bacterium CG17_big_fil_post_rev_8_21_14_2_50_40_13]
MSEFLELKNIAKTYVNNEKPAVHGLAFSMNEGEIISFVGASGSGKSTLLKLVGGLIAQDKGTITFKGKALTKPEDKLIAGEEGIKMLFQDLKLMPNHSVAENIKYPLLKYNSAYQIERTNELLALCGLMEYKDRFPKQLSGGQQQRLALAKTLAEDPELLLMDEPFSNLDPIVKKRLVKEVVQIVKSEGLSLILVTHDTEDALMISDRIGFIDQGKLLQLGTPEEIYNHPQKVIVAEFFGNINLFTSQELKRILGSKHRRELSKGQVYGIRTEDFSVLPIKSGVKLKPKVVHNYYVGSASILEVIIEGKRIEIRVPANTKPSDLKEIYINPSLIMELAL